MILDMGVDIRYNTPVTSLRALLDEGFDAVFVGRGRAARQGARPARPLRRDASRTSTSASTGSSRSPSATSTRSASACSSSASATPPWTAAARRAASAAPTSRSWRDDRASSSRPRPGSSTTPRRRASRSSSTTRRRASSSRTGASSAWSSTSLEWDEGATRSTSLDTVVIPCDDVILAIGQENAFPWIERDLGMSSASGTCPSSTRRRWQSSAAGRLLRRRRRVGTEEHHLGRRARPRGRDLDPQPLQRASPITNRPAQGMNLVSQKMGMSEWSYHNDYNPSPRQKMTHVELTKRFESLNLEVELGFSAEQTAREVQRCLNCDIQTAFTAPLCIECDACIDICPVQCLTITENGDEADLRGRLLAPAHQPRPGPLRLRASAPDRPRDGEGRERLRALRALRRALPDGRLGHGELRARHPLRRVEELHPASRSASAATEVGRDDDRDEDGERRASRQRLRGQARQRQRHGLGERQQPARCRPIFRMGIPVSGKNLFPSNIQGLPTWYEIRVNKPRATPRAPSTTTSWSR